MASEQKSVLFVCLGNTCRSTMAEGIFRHLVEHNGLQNQIIYKDFTSFQYILGMDSWNLRSLEQYKPKECTAQIGLLGSYDVPGESKEIYDPFMAQEEVFEEVFTKCYRCCHRFLISHHPEIGDKGTEF